MIPAVPGHRERIALLSIAVPDDYSLAVIVAGIVVGVIVGGRYFTGGTRSHDVHIDHLGGGDGGGGNGGGGNGGGGD